MTKCVVYTRVSSDEQAKVGYSIPFQRAKLEQYADEHGLEVVQRFEDVQTAKQGGRPGFNAMLRFLEERPAVRTVLVHRLDRLSRNFSDYATVTERMGLKIRSVVEPIEDNAAGVMQHGVTLAMAKYYSANLSAEVRKGLRARFEAGGCIAKAPPGYRNVPRTKTQKATVAVDEDRAATVRRAFERYATGRVGLSAVAHDLYDGGLRTKHGKPYAAEKVRLMLRNPFYVGRVRYLGEVRPGLHPGIVPEPVWHQVQAALRIRATDPGEKGKKLFLLRGFLFCGRCHRRMTAEDHPRGSYYRCQRDAFGASCDAAYIPVKKLDEAVESLLPTLVMRPDVKAAVVAELRGRSAERAEERAREERHLRTRADHLRSRLRRLADGFASGDLSRDDLRALRPSYEHELAAAESQIAMLSEDLSERVRELEGFLETATKLSGLYNLCNTLEERKRLLAQVFKRVEVVGADLRSIEYHSPFGLLLGATPVDAGSKTEREVLAANLLDGDRTASAPCRPSVR